VQQESAYAFRKTANRVPKIKVEPPTSDRGDETTASESEFDSGDLESASQCSSDMEGSEPEAPPKKRLRSAGTVPATRSASKGRSTSSDRAPGRRSSTPAIAPKPRRVECSLSPQLPTLQEALAYLVDVAAGPDRKEREADLELDRVVRARLWLSDTR
jgi:hypothetical protein